ncbi:hypothetical protein [Bilifractor porci]|uniref:C2H2-type domain-containing protein n=1 Tax=Bilifractor porci TaxID=2606636 RepID=A0A7X2PAC5_9FIRM|nr:hypothetical protein [Bilifractor porci]MST83000.1 hypothetical protein [Bilifractor porci]
MKRTGLFLALVMAVTLGFSGCSQMTGTQAKADIKTEKREVPVSEEKVQKAAEENVKKEKTEEAIKSDPIATSSVSGESCNETETVAAEKGNDSAEKEETGTSGENARADSDMTQTQVTKTEMVPQENRKAENISANTTGAVSGNVQTTGSTPCQKSDPSCQAPKVSETAAAVTENNVPIPTPAPSGHYVHHEAVTHEEPVYETVTQQVEKCICNDCGEDVTDLINNTGSFSGHAATHPDCWGYHTEHVTVSQQVQTGTRTVVDQEAWDEWVAN